MSTRETPRKRRRLVISCTECHRRKQKCDRESPCSNCVTRGKETDCRYETRAELGRDERPRKEPKSQSTAPSDASGSSDHTLPRAHPRGAASPPETFTMSLSDAAADWGYSKSRISTLELLKKIDGLSSGTRTQQRLDDQKLLQSSSSYDAALRDRYRSLIRQLPPRGVVARLVDRFFRRFNYHYCTLDRDVFDGQLVAFQAVPFGVLSSEGPAALGADLRVFPALLFQVVAIALLDKLDGPAHEMGRGKGEGEGEGEDQRAFEGLKYAEGMTFEDVSAEWSETGSSLLSLLGKRVITLTTIQAGFLRANWLKYMAKVTESWHALGSAIRDAQEIGMHRDSLDPEPDDSDVGSVLENMWLVERRRRMYTTLIIWDLHCSVILGRPPTMDHRLPPPTPPADAPFPSSASRRRSTPVRPRDEEKDPPTPLTRLLWYSKLMSPLRSVMELDQEGPCPRDYAKVNRVHRTCVELDESLPAYFRFENPDTRWDALPECEAWLVDARSYLVQLPQYCLMALHRRYMFQRRESRLAALKASVEIVRRQKPVLDLLKRSTWRNFSLFFGSFDAVVLMASTYILFPGENHGEAEKTLELFRWTMDRFDALSGRNPLARAARGVLRTVYAKFENAVRTGSSEPKLVPGSDESSKPRDPAASISAPAASNSENLATSSVQPSPVSFHTLTTPLSGYAEPSTSLGLTALQPDGSLDFGFPMGDLMFHDLNGSLDDASLAESLWGGMNAGQGNPREVGDWGGTSLWGALNQYGVDQNQMSMGV